MFKWRGAHGAMVSGVYFLAAVLMGCGGSFHQPQSELNRVPSAAENTPVPPPADEELPNEDPRDESPKDDCDTVALSDCEYVRSLMQELIGFGENTKGGINGDVYWVTNSDDSGPGSLRTALESDRPMWIRFASDVAIQLSKKIRVRSHKTIDGRGRSVRISGYGLFIAGQSHIIINDIEMVDGEVDAIGIQDSSHDIWIHHCELSNYTDGLIDIKRNSDDITVSWNLLRDHNKGMLLGLQKKHTDDSHQFITLHHNYFKNIVQRAPRVAQSWVHHFNNYHYNWQGYVISVSEEGEVFAENNIFELGPKSNRHAFDFMKDTGPGYLRSVGNSFQGGTLEKENEPGRVGHPSQYYNYTADTADKKLKNRLINSTGPRVNDTSLKATKNLSHKRLTRAL